MKNQKYSPDICHSNLYDTIKPKLAYMACGDKPEYKEELGTKLKEILGDFPEAVPLNFKIISDVKRKEFRVLRIEFDSEKDTTVPGYLTLPYGVEKPPVIIALQGHAKGMYLSLGVFKSFKDWRKLKLGDRQFAVIAAQNGYASLVLEQRCFGERETSVVHDYAGRCLFSGMNALLLGRTMIGERVWDIMRAIDACEQCLGEYIDASKIACMGNSGGGTATYYAAAIDKRIAIAMPSCSVCSYKLSLGSVRHCCCNYLPKALKYFDMGDLGALISPRHLVVVAGKKDDLFPLEGVNSAFDIIKAAYVADGVGENCALYVGNGGHRFYKDAFEIFNKYAKKLNWR